jgi:N-acetylmuramoyl-L-alanine amidase
MKAENIKFIVVHCSDSPQFRGDNAETIHHWHSDPKPAGNDWDGIGYHRVILEDGTVEHGRPLYWTGSHVRGHNRESIGICLIGDGVYTLKQWAALKAVVGEMEKYAPNALVVGHNDLDTDKECPKFDVKAWWGDGLYNDQLITQEEIDMLLKGD